MLDVTTLRKKRRPTTECMHLACQKEEQCSFLDAVLFSPPFTVIDAERQPKSIKMPNCAVLSCKNSTRKFARDNGNVSFHRFPNNPNVKEKWIDATGQKNWFPTKHSRICSVHFNDGSFTETKKFPRLTTTAIPTIDVLKTSTDDKNKDQKLTANKPLPCNTSRQIKLENGKDIHQPSTSNEDTPVNTRKKKELVHKLNLAQQKIKQQTKQIKRLREQNRRKCQKILTLMTLLWQKRKN